MDGTKANFSFADLEGTPLGNDPQALADVLDSVPVDPDSDRITQDGARLPGRGDKILLLTSEQESKLATELCTLVARCDEMMADRWDKEDEIEDAYALVTNLKRTGQYEGASQLASEMMMSAVDQATARTARTILDVTPRFKVSAIPMQDLPMDQAVQMANATENFLENYLRKQDIDSKLSMAVHRADKLGTAVIELDWEDHEETYRIYDHVTKRPVERTRQWGGLQWNLIRNQDMVLWPPWVQDWQQADVCGHRETMTISEWRRTVKENDIDRELARQVEMFARSQGASDDQKKILDRSSINAEAEASDRGLVRIAKLWCNMPLPGDGEENYDPVRFLAVVHLGLRKIIWIDYNPLNSQKHPYYPIRYKPVDGSAWGDGIGHEILFSHMADEAFRNLGMDNLISTAHSVVLLSQGSGAEQVADRIYPGMRIPTEDPDGDMKVVSLASAGPIELIYEAQRDNETRKMNASGMASVLAGMGDPTMKSGGGTGAVLALIEQAGKKFGMIDANLRMDISALAVGSTEFVAQYAPEGLYVENATAEDASLVGMMKFIPPQGDLQSMFRISVRAPSAAANRESQKQSVMQAYTFLLQHAQMLLQTAIPELQQDNPLGAKQYQHDLLNFIGIVANRVLELSDVPELGSGLPPMPEMTPVDQQFKQLMDQLQQAMGQIQSLQQQIQTLQMQGANGGQPYGTPTPPSGPGAAPPAAPLPGPAGLPPGGDMGATQ